MNINFLKALLLVLIHLKLSGEIDWSWWAVMLPLMVDAASFTFFDSDTGRRLKRWALS